MNAADSLDAKVATILAMGSAILGILGAVLVVRPQSDETIAALVVAVGAPWIFMSLLAIQAYAVVEFEVGPDLNQVWQDHDSGVSPNEVRGRAAESYKENYEKNYQHIQVKARAVQRGLWAFLFQTAAVSSGLVLVAAGVIS